LGILGGTFDPVHVGHLVAAVNAKHALDLDRVLLVVANEPWQKVGSRPVTSAADRLALVAAAVEGVEGLEASGIEIERGGPSYTADTVAELKDRWPDVELDLIVGADAAAGLGEWERIEEVRSKVVLVVVNRPGTTIDESGQDSPLDGWDIEHRPAGSGRIGATPRLPGAHACHPPDPRTRLVPCAQMRRHGTHRDTPRRVCCCPLAVGVALGGLSDKRVFGSH
jgi:nicotinate (nicotinamide) nucleotide adenylyltransferase